MIALFALWMREATKAEVSKIWPLKKMLAWECLRCGFPVR
jgi:hypothetical protein